MTAQLASTGYGYTESEESPRLNDPGKKHRGEELGFAPAAGVQWTRERPKAPGVYPVVPRCGGLWCGDTRSSRADWRGWWCSLTVDEARALKRAMPPAGEWTEGNER